jgi:hypothetical protein
MLGNNWNYRLNSQWIWFAPYVRTKCIITVVGRYENRSHRTFPIGVRINKSDAIFHIPYTLNAPYVGGASVPLKYVKSTVF